MDVVPVSVQESDQVLPVDAAQDAALVALGAEKVSVVQVSALELEAQGEDLDAEVLVSVKEPVALGAEKVAEVRALETELEERVSEMAMARVADSVKDESVPAMEMATDEALDVVLAEARVADLVTAMVPVFLDQENVVAVLPLVDSSAAPIQMMTSPREPLAKTF